MPTSSLKNLKNEIDIQCYKTMDKSNEEQILKLQNILINKVKEVEKIGMAELSGLTNSFQEIKAEMKELNKSSIDHEEIEGRLSEALLEVEKVMLKNRSIHFMRSGKGIDENNHFLGLIVIIEDQFISRETFNKK